MFMCKKKSNHIQHIIYKLKEYKSLRKTKKKTKISFSMYFNVALNLK